MFQFKSKLSKNQLISVFMIGCGLFVIFNFLLYWEYSYTRRSNEAVIHYYERLRSTREILTDLLSMETGVRGYLLTAQPKFLQPYNEAKVWLSNETATLKTEVKDDDPETQIKSQKILADIQRLQNLLSAELQLAQKPIKLPTLIRTVRQQKDLMDYLRLSFKDFMRASQADLDIHLEKLKQKQEFFTIMLVAGTLGVIGAMMLALITISSLAKRSQESEEEILATEERFRMVMNGVNDGLYDYNLNSGHIYFSPAYKNMLGFDDDEFTNSIDMLNLLIHPEDLQQMWAIFGSYQRRETSNYINIFRMRHKEGGWRWVMSRGIGIWDQNGQLARLIGTHTDITEQKKREEELRELNTDLESFAYITSHDLRAPLVNLKGFTSEMMHSLEVIKPVLDRAGVSLSDDEKAAVRQTFEKDIPEALRFIQRSVDKMDMLTGAVLDLSRIGRRDFAMGPVDVNAVITRCLDNLAYELSQKSAEVHVEKLPIITCDAAALEQIIGNLLDNAVKYLDPTRKGLIQISAEILKNEVVFAVRDNGRGIDGSDHTKVFEIFRRARNVGDERGLGMGLAYVKTTLRKLGGTIWFESTAGEGTVFYIRLPHMTAIHDVPMEKAA